MYLKLSPFNGYCWCPLGKFSHLGLEQLLAWSPASSFKFVLTFVALGIHRFWDSRHQYLVLGLQKMASQSIPVGSSSTILQNCIDFSLKDMTLYSMNHWATIDVMFLRDDYDPMMRRTFSITWDPNASKPCLCYLMRYIFLRSSTRLRIKKKLTCWIFEITDV